MLVSITCHSKGSLPYSRLCWHSQGKASLGLLTAPTSVMQGDTEQHRLPGASAAGGEEKPAHTALAASSVLDRAGKVSVSTFCSPTPAVPKLQCVTTVPALTPVWHWGSSVSSKAQGVTSTILIYTPEFRKDSSSANGNNVSPNTLRAFCRFIEKGVDFIHKHQTHEH